MSNGRVIKKKYMRGRSLISLFYICIPIPCAEICPAMSLRLLEYTFSSEVRAFSTYRQGRDADASPYAGFNITDYCGDSPEHVQECRRWLCRELALPESHLLLPRQTHSNRVLTVDEAFCAHSEAHQQSLMQGIDALVTSRQNICIGISTADCVPLLLLDPTVHVSAAIHAGWRGMAAHIISSAVEQMVALGASPAAIKAVVGPSIGPSSFEVGEEVVRNFLEHNFPETIVMRQYPKPHIDLWAAATFELERVGVDLQQIYVVGADTYTQSDDFFSARRLGGQSGRIYSGIVMYDRALSKEKDCFPSL